MTDCAIKTNTEIYEAAYKAYTPDEDALKYPDNITFYRAWYGLKALLNSYGYDDIYNAPINAHTLCCWEKSGEYAQVIKALSCVTPKPPVAERRYSMFCRSAPTYQVEKDAVEIFNRNYKEKFPGKRLGTKHCKEQWEKVKEKAKAMAHEEYNERYAEYAADVKKHEDREAAEEAEFQKKVAGYEAQMALIRKLEQP